VNLYPYQQEGVDYLSSNARAYLADEPGLGKTVQASVAARKIGPRSVVIVAPAATLPNWRREWETWGPPVEPRLLSYANRDLLGQRVGNPDLVILDEAHYCKTRTARRAVASLDLAAQAPVAWLLSGSPMPNHPGELWMPLSKLWPEVPRMLGVPTYSRWMSHFTIQRSTKWGRSVVGTRNLDQLRPHLKSIMLRRTLDQVGIQLPPLRVDVSLLEWDQVLQDELTEVMRSTLGYEDLDPRHLEGEVASRVRRILGEYKAPTIARQLLDELEQDQYEQIVVLAHHHSVLDLIEEGLPGITLGRVDGSTTPKRRQEIIDAFREGHLRVFLGQQTATGTGLNLQTAHEIVLVEPDWDPENNRQAIKRVHRLGSTRSVRARVFAVADSLDEAITTVIARKTRAQVELGLRTHTTGGAA
jgi:SWI/SNF-related matrix-associated actin-dependent regulator of chromatin subfamily A-like protein 1